MRSPTPIRLPSRWPLSATRHSSPATRRSSPSRVNRTSRWNGCPESPDRVAQAAFATIESRKSSRSPSHAVDCLVFAAYTLNWRRERESVYCNSRPPEPWRHLLGACTGNKGRCRSRVAGPDACQRFHDRPMLGGTQLRWARFQGTGGWVDEGEARRADESIGGLCSAGVETLIRQGCRLMHSRVSCTEQPGSRR
jgi:hypothetical protein